MFNDNTQIPSVSEEQLPGWVGACLPSCLSNSTAAASDEAEFCPVINRIFAGIAKSIV